MRILRRLVADREEILVVGLLLMAIIAVFLLRIPSHPLLSYGSTAVLRASRSHWTPSSAILPDIFCVAMLVVLPMLCSRSTVQQHGPAADVLEVFQVIPALRC